MKNWRRIFWLFVMTFAIIACEQDDPEFTQRSGDKLSFAGRQWIIKTHLDSLVGPGNNYFSDFVNDVFVDDNGYLHLTITERDGKWYSTEVVSEENMGFGTYTFTIEGNPLIFDKNAVLGLFTWDDSTFQVEANSEVDIEFAKWGNEDDTLPLQYGVQPIAFGPYNAERVDKPEVDNRYWNGVSTHIFTWTDTLITWQSWQGGANDIATSDTTAFWSFDDSNPAKIKFEGPNQSDPVVIPKPGDQTNARMNFWINGGNAVGLSNGERHEIIIRDFDYQPL